MTNKTDKKQKQSNDSKPKSVKKEEKFRLIDLVRKSELDEALIVGALADNHLLTDYYKEQESLVKGIDVTPSITETEFNKLINTFKKKEV